MSNKLEPVDGHKAAPKELSYFEKRMQQLGITPELNKIAVRQHDAATNKTVLNEVPIFRETDLGIDIVVYNLNRNLIQYKPDGSRWSKTFALTRLKDPVIKPDGVMKYRIPKGAGTYPFFPPSIIDKYEQKIPMKTVFLTEGYFKAFKGYMHGLDVIGLSSITHMKDKDTGGLHQDIVALVKSGLVERFVWLTDGDCLDLTNKEITEDKDLYTRPYQFYNSITTFRNLLDGYDDIEKWFMHIDTDAIMQENKGKITRDQVKGLDDLLISLPDKQEEIVADMTSFGRSGFYFKRFDITGGTGKVWRYFHLINVDDFFNFHVDRRPELKTKEFKFHGTRYLFDEAKNQCEIRMPGEANLYFRVGDDYYKFIEKPNQHGKIERVITERKKTTITDDHGKNFAKHIPKYEAFCNVPDHNNFQQVIHNCFNVYSPIDFQPEEDKCVMEDCPTIIGLIRHIWGDKKVHFKDKETSTRYEYENWQLGLDYLQLLYQQPAQKLPILCLVSRENGTGKSTLGFFLRNMLGANVAIVGNADLSSDFNAHWATKSVVVVDEAKIDKHQVIEKIKMLSTAKKIYMNAKGRGQVELDCFIKFILITNNEDSFVTMTDDDIRYWVLKVPVLRKEDPRVLDKLVEEIPAFLSFLNDRKLVSEEKTRMWFKHELLQTEAQRRVIEHSEPVVVKEIRTGLKDLFLDTQYDEILMTPDVIKKELLSKKVIENYYLSRLLKDVIKVQPYHKWTVQGLDRIYETEKEALAAAEVKYPDCKGHMIYDHVAPKYMTIRYSYPSWVEKTNTDGTKERVRVDCKDSGRPYVFRKKDFVTESELAQLQVAPETAFLAEVNQPVLPSTLTAEDDELPFPIK